MKIRNGFVSNSSTSSFVIVGYRVGRSKFNSKQKQIDFISKLYPEALKGLDVNNVDEVEDTFNDLLYSGDCENFDVYSDSEGDSIYVGKLMGTYSSDGGNDISGDKFDIDEINKKCDNAKEMFGLSGKPKIYGGVSAS